MSAGKHLREVMRKYYWAILLALGIGYFLLDIRILRYAIVALFGLVALLMHRFRVGSFPDKKAASGISMGRDEEREAKNGPSHPWREAPAGPIPRLRLWLFRLIAVVVSPVLALLLIELGLRMAGYGYPSHAIVKFRADGKPYYSDNVKFAWRFFARNIAREMEPFILTADKPDGTYRVFVLGSSAAMGVPNTACSLGRILGVMLREEYPGVNFEVKTAAMAAINSHVVLEIAKDCARCEPDLFIVYLGNNEVTGPYGAGTVFAPLSGNLTLIRAGIALKGTKLGQLVTNALGSVGVGKAGPEAWRSLEMFVDKQVRADSASLQSVYRHFQRNLEDIVRVGRKGGAKVILCTVGSNLKDNPPFGSLHRVDLSQTQKGKWDELYEQGVRRESAGEYGEAVDCYLAAGEIDDCYADLQFRLGRCCWAMGEYDKAKQRYIKARELDTLRFRADDRINEIIRGVASRMSQGVYLVDAVKVFEQNSPQGVTGSELFYEHVHLNFKGTYLLSRAIFQRVQKILSEGTSGPGKSGGSVLTEVECAGRLAYTEWDQYKAVMEVIETFVSKAPFTTQLYHEQHIMQVEQTLKTLRYSFDRDNLERMAALHRRAIEDDGMDWHMHYKYGRFLAEGLKEYEGAAEQFRWVQQHFPHSYTGYNALGDTLREGGDLKGAIAQYVEVLRINPACVPAHFQLGWSYEKLGRLDKAVEYYYKTIRLQPRAVLAYNNLGQALYALGKLEEAIRILRRALEFCPDSAVLHGNMGVLLGAQGHRDEAIKELRGALRIDPNSVGTAEVLDRLMKMGSGKPEGSSALK